MCAELATLESLPPEIQTGLCIKDLRRIDRLYVTSLSTKRAKKDSKKVEKMASDVIAMKNEFGLPNVEDLQGLKKKIIVAIRYGIFAKQLFIDNLRENAKKVSGRLQSIYFSFVTVILSKPGYRLEPSHLAM